MKGERARGEWLTCICVDAYAFELRYRCRCPPEVVNLVNLWEGG